jgi:hypothetical protein
MIVIFGSVAGVDICRCGWDGPVEETIVVLVSDDWSEEVCVWICRVRDSLGKVNGMRLEEGEDGRRQRGRQ